MIKRLLIVLLCAAGIVLVPYLIGEYLSPVKNYERMNSAWLDGFVFILLIILCILSLIGIYSIGCLIYDYIIGKK